MSFKLSLAASREKIVQECGKITLPKSFTHKYQINPGEKVFCLLDINPTRMYTIEWGLIPHWAKRLNNRANLTEMNVEDIASKPSSRIPFRSKRGIIVADAIYFIRKKGLELTPYRIERKDGQLMRFACLWDEWKSEDKYMATTAMVTRKVSSFISDSFPIEFNQEETQAWMEEENLSVAENMLNKAFRPELYNFYKVTNRILDTEYNEQDLQVAVPEEVNLFSFL
ncbi:SOS response-associated peptidase [Saprospiraceae bacterium]|nr:SOS response-associated peptidase [Saprospiraceae bacterium]